MAKLGLKVASTSKLVRIFIADSSSATGAGLTGLVFNSGSLVAYYLLEGAAAPVQITLVTMTVGTWVSGGFKEVDATNMPGVYELGLPNAALASGKSVLVMLKGATNMTPTLLEVDLVTYDPYAAAADLGLQTVTIADVGGVANTWGGIMSLLRAYINGKFTGVSGLLQLFGQNNTTQIGVDRTVTGTVPSDFSRS